MTDAYAKLINHMRDAGAEYNGSGLEIANVVSVSPIKLKINGTDIEEDILKLGGVKFAVDDAVAVYRIGEEMTLILGKVVNA